METRIYYRVVTPSTFSDLNYSTLEEAQKALDEFGTVKENSEYFQYWQEQKAKCYIAKVTETLEKIS